MNNMVARRSHDHMARMVASRTRYGVTAYDSPLKKSLQSAPLAQVLAPAQEAAFLNIFSRLQKALHYKWFR